MSRANPLRLTDYLSHIVDAIERCHSYVEDMDEAAFRGDNKTQDAVIRTFEIVGEASNNVRKHYPEFARQHPEVPFGFAYEMRNALAHGYFTVDLEIVWHSIHTDMPGLHRAIRSLLDELSGKE